MYGWNYFSSSSVRLLSMISTSTMILFLQLLMYAEQESERFASERVIFFNIIYIIIYAAC